MTNKKSTKRALLASTLALILCFAMLLGTTFAWFTDSVASANNIIKSGNLDIELEYWNGEKWVDVKEKADILTNKLWEPGVTEVAYLRIANAGSLAFKYRFGINILSETAGVNVEGDEFLLSNYIMFGVVEGIDVDADSKPATYASRKDAIEDINIPKKISAGYAKPAYMQPDEELYLALVVYMPTSVGNVANHNGETIPEINLGINVMATQVASEEDSFDKYYDGATPWLGGIDTDWYTPDATEYKIGSAEELAGLAQLVNTCVDSFDGKTVTLVSDIDLKNIDWTPIGDVDAEGWVGFNGTFDGQGYTINNLKITSDSWGQGLFGYMPDAVTVKNVNINNVDITAGDCCGALFGWGTKGTFSNIHVTGNVSVIGTSGDGYVGGIVGHGYNATFENCSVITDNGVISGGGSFVGGIVGYQCNNAKTIKDCSVEGLTITGYAAVGGIAGIVQTGGAAIDNCSVKNVVINKARVDGNPSIGALVGNYSGTAATTLTGKVENVTLNGTHVAYAAFNVLYGSNYSGATTPNFDVSGVVGVDTVTNNLVEVSMVSDGVVKDDDNTYTVYNSNGLKPALTAAAAANAGDNTIVLAGDIDLTGTTWAPIKVDGYHGAGVVTIEGNGATVTGLSAPLFAGGFAGKSGIVIKNLTIADSTIVSTSGLGGGAFVDTADSMQVITLENCHLLNSTVTGERVGGLIGWVSGYANENDGPVKTYVTITNCSVVDSDVIGAGSAGAIAGHPGASDYTWTTIENCVIKNVDVVSNDDGSWRTGAVVGTANNGHVVISNVSVANVTLSQNGVAAEKIALFGRFVPGETGTLVIDGTPVVATADALAAALTADKENVSVILAADINLPITSLGAQTPGSGEYKLGGDSTKSIVIDLNGQKLNITTTYWSGIGAKNANATFTIKNGTMTSSQASGTWNSYDLTFANCNYVIENVVFEKAIAFTNANKSVKLNTVTINETHDYYALWITAEGQDVEINGLTVNSAGRGIKIDEQYVDSPAKVTLKVSDATFNTNNKAAIMVKSVAGAEITVENVDITGVAADATNAVWVDEDAAAYAALVTVTGATVITEP
ncbi:MAG: hypothetical protein IKB41_01705 [Clostridia bacterium]|nr:hypothetical protein [Clostridia bacterium]